MGRLVTERCFTAPMQLQFERVYCPYLLLHVNRYAGMKHTHTHTHTHTDAHTRTHRVTCHVLLCCLASVCMCARVCVCVCVCHPGRAFESEDQALHNTPVGMLVKGVRSMWRQSAPFVQNVLQVGSVASVLHLIRPCARSVPPLCASVLSYVRHMPCVCV